jgi:hypothetical protein
MSTPTNIRILYQNVPIASQVFWCLSLLLALTIATALAIALWKLGVVGGIAIGILLRHLLSA